MIKRNIEALKQLRRVVEAAPDDERFDMSTIEEKKPCGTVRCAIGWARVDPWFRANTSIRVRPVTLWEETGSDVFGLTFDESSNLFGSPIRDDNSGLEIKVLVLDNIDRAINGEEIIGYD